MRPGPAFILRITLAETRPEIWRRLVVPADITLARLHAVIQLAMGWSDAFSHYFADQSGKFYVVAKSGGAVNDARGVRLEKLLQAPSDRIRYVYNCAARWEHIVTLEAVKARALRPARAKCLAGARRCPPEDCAGPADFGALLKALSHGRRAKFQSAGYCRGWIEGPFQPGTFDHAAVSASLKSVRV